MSLFHGLACASIAVPSIEQALPAFVDGMGLQLISTRTSSRYPLRWSELGDNQQTFLELLEPTTENSLVQRYLERRGPGIYQLRFYVANLEATLRTLEARGVAVVPGNDIPGEPRVGFIHPRSASGVLFELMERLPPEGATR